MSKRLDEVMQLIGGVGKQKEEVRTEAASSSGVKSERLKEVQKYTALLPLRYQEAQDAGKRSVLQSQFQKGLQQSQAAAKPEAPMSPTAFINQRLGQTDQQQREQRLQTAWETGELSRQMREDPTQYQMSIAQKKVAEAATKLQEAEEKVKALQARSEELSTRETGLASSYTALQGLLEQYQRTGSDVDGMAYILAAKQYDEMRTQYNADLEQYQKDAAAYNKYDAAWEKAQKAQIMYEDARAKYLEAHPYENYLNNQENMSSTDIQALIDELDRQIEEAKRGGYGEELDLVTGSPIYANYDKIEQLTAQRGYLAAQMEQTKASEWENQKREEILAAGGEELLSKLREYDLTKKGKAEMPYEEIKAMMTDLVAKGYSNEQIMDMVDFAARLNSAEEYDAAIEKSKQTAAEHPVLASLGSVAGSLTSGFGMIDAADQNLRNLLSGKETPVNYKTPLMVPSGATNAIRKQVSSDIEAATAGKAGSDTALGNLYSDAYQLAMSMADSLGVVGLTAMGVHYAGVLLGGSAATSAMMEAKERGATDAQALIMGVLSGVAETLFEQYSIDKLFSLESPTTVKAALKNILKQAIPEASEEFNTTIANTVADFLVMGDKSQWATAEREYMAQGMTAEEAKKQAGLDWFLGLMGDALGGFISGGLFAMGSNVINGTHRSQSTQTKATVETKHEQQNELEGVQWAGNTTTQETANGGTNNADEQNSERGTDTGGDAERENGVDAQESTGDQSTEWTAELQRRAGAAAEVDDYVETLRSQNKLRDITTADLNVTGGISTDHVGVVQYSDQNEQMRSIWERGSELGIDTVFVTNPLTVESGGKIVQAIAEHKEGRIIVQVNNAKMDMEQAANHETYHVLADKNKELVRKTKEILLNNYSDEEFTELVRKYEEIYSDVYAAQDGMTEELVAERILEEMLADAYADYQRFENADARKFTETVREQAAPVAEAAKQDAQNERPPTMTEETIQSELKKERPKEKEYLDAIRKLQNQRDQGEITAEEYERQVLDYIEGEAGNQRVSEAYSRFSIEGSEDQLPEILDAGIQQAAAMEPVREMDGTEFAKGEKNLTDQVGEYFDSIGNRVVNHILGEVVLDKRGVKDDMAHGIGRKKAITFLAVPDVIEQGGMIDYQENWKGRGYDTAVLAAPVKIAGEDYMMGVVLNRYSEENDFYVHEVLAESDEGAAPFKTGTIKDGTPGGDTPSVISLLRKVLDVKKSLSNTAEREAQSDFAAEETEDVEVLDGDSLTEEIRHTMGGVESFLNTIPKTAQTALDKKMRAGAKLLADGMWTKNTEEFTKAMEEITNTYMELGTIPAKMEKQLFDTLYPLAAEHKGGKTVVWNNFRANIRQIMSELKEVRSYVKSKIDNKNAKQRPVEEDTVETVEKLWQTVKQQRKDYERVAAQYTLSNYDRVLIGQLLRGEISIRQIPSRNANKKAVIAVYEAKQLYEDTMRRLGMYKVTYSQMQEDVAKGVLLELENWKDTDKGWKLNINTFERNLDAAAPTQEIADKAKATYGQPIHKNEAKSNQFKNTQRERIKALHLGLRARNGNKLSESAAVQLLGEAEANVEYLKNRPKDTKRDGKTMEEWQAEIVNLWATNPNMDQQKIKNAVQVFREIYDMVFQMMNEVRIRNGYEPVDYRKGYFPHYQNTEPDGILAAFGKMMGVSNEIKPLPTTINGLTKNFKPGIPWLANALSRKGTDTVLGAVEGFDMYLDGVADVIYHTDDIQRLRALAREIRYLAGDEGLKERADEIKSQDIPQAEKEEKLDKLYQNNKDGGRYQLSNFIWWLDEYTNQFANKRAAQDRDIEQKAGRWFYNVVSAWERRVAVNMVAINPASWLTNFIPLTQAWGAVQGDHLLHGMASTVTNDLMEMLNKIAPSVSDYLSEHLHMGTDGMVDRSAFLTNRRGSTRMVRSWMSKASSAMSSPMNMIDDFVSDSIVRARYIQNKSQGLSDEAALDEADAFAASVIADRSKGALPTIFNEKNPFSKLLTMFQVEQVNQFMFYSKDLPREAKKKGNAALVLYMLAKVCLGALIYNELYEKLVGRRPAFDPFGMVKDVAQGLMDGKEMYEVVAGFGKEALEQMPFIGGYLGGGRFPISSALPNFVNLGKAAFSESWSQEKRLNTLWSELKDPLLYTAPPFGGGQIKKIMELITAVRKHGSYNTSGELQYPVFTDNGKDKAVTWSKGILFGKSSLEGAVEWVGSGFSSMSEKYTTAYQVLMELGETDRDAYDTVKAIQEAKAPEGESDEALKRQVLHDAAVSGEAKFAAYYELLAGDKEKDLMDSLDGEDPETVYELLNKLKDLSKTNEKREALMASGLSETGRETVWKYLQGSSEEQVERAEELMDLAKGTGLGVDDLMEMQMTGVNFDLYEEMTTAGISGDAAYCATMALREAETANGPETDLKPNEKYQIILDNVSSAQEQAIAISSLMQDSQRETFEALIDKGLTPKQYVEYKTATDGLVSDKDENGNSIPGTKKKKVLEAINAMRISDELKTALYFAEGYSINTLDEAPWDTSSASGLTWAGS